MGDTRAQELLRISDGLFSRKRTWDSLCQDIAENFYPLRSDFTTSFSLGTDFATGLMDGTTINMRETLGNSIDSMLRQGDWFSISTGDEARDKRAGNALALSRATSLFRKGVIADPRSNVQMALKEADHDWVAFGNPVLSWEEAPARSHLITRAWHPKLCAWMVNEYGVVDGFFRKCMLPARDIHRKFKQGAWTGHMRPEIERAAKDEPTREFPVIHLLMEAEEVYGGSAADMRRNRHRYVSMYIDQTHTEVLNSRGTPVFNYIVPRYRTVSNFPQGFSPVAINSLPDARMLQSLALTLLEQGEKGVDPPIVVSQDIFKNDFNLYAGGVSAVDLGQTDDIRKAMQVVNTSDGMPVGLQMKQDVRALLAEHWLLNKLFLPSVREMRELEVMVRTEEFRRAALPFFTPIESQYHSPWLSVGFEMAVNMGLIPAEIFPEDLQGQDITWKFESPLKEAEGQKVVAAFNTSVQIIAAGSEAEPGLAKQFNIADAVIDAVRGAGAKPEWIKPERERKAVAEEDAQVAQLQKTAALLDQGAATTANVSGAKVAAEQAGLL
jgi:hypothetical protein